MSSVQIKEQNKQGRRSPCIFTHMNIVSWSLEDVIISKVYTRRPVFVHQTFHFALLSSQGLRIKVRVPASARLACVYQCTRVQFNLFHSLLLSFSTVRGIVTKNSSSLGLICCPSRKHKVLF